MFSSTRISDAGLQCKSDKDNSLDETTNKSFLRPKITSTPLRRESIFATPPKPRILSPHRYSLSEAATPPRSNRRSLSISNSYRYNPGPLLTSTNFNVNVSTYEDTKTPGLAGRIVQYNEEADQEKESQRLPTHQAQYGTVGLFPIVHLFKKKLPLLQKKPRHVTVRIASPDYARQHTQEYNRKLLEGIAKPGGGGFGFLPSKNETANTRSVLDALKEISRKRMHTSEELEMYEDSGKRLRTDNSDNEDAPEGNKRQRDDSPLETSISPSRPTSKKICLYDEYAASCSSMDYKKLAPLLPKRKLVSISTLTDNPKESKQVKLINVETQTAQELRADKSASFKQKIREVIQTEVDESLINSSESAIRVFDDAPLERIRTNRLAALLGSLVGKDAVLVPKPNVCCEFNGDATTESSILNTTDKPLVSILSTPNKSLNKPDRHVRFSIPESTHQTTTSTFSSLTSSSSSTTDLVNVSSSASSQTIGTTRLATPGPSSPVNLAPTSTAVSSSTTLGTLGLFGATVSTASTVNSSNSSIALISKEPAPTPTASIAVSKPSLSTFASTSSPVSAQLNFPLPASSSPPKMGGFKFDLNKPTSAAVSVPNVTQSATNLFPTSQKLKTQDSPFGSAPTSVVSPTFSFGSKLAAPTTSSTPATLPNSTSIISTIASTPAMPSLNFATSKNNNSGTSTNNTANISSASLFTPGSATTSVTDASKTSTFSFGSTTHATGVSSSAPFTFDTPKADTATAPASATSAGFTVTSATSSLVPNLPASTPFSGTTVNLSQGNKPATTSAPASGNNTIFGSTSTSTAPLFGTTSTSTASPFGSNPVFGQSTTQASVLTPSTTSSFSASNAFGSTTPSTTASFIFAGSNNVSGTTPKIFGGTTVTQASGFGAPTAPQASSFGSTTVTQATGFGAPIVTQATGFGAPSTTNSLFGSSTGVSFGSTAPTFTFGSKTSNTTSVGFGTPTTTTSSFGAPTGTGFGTTTGQSTGFGATTGQSTAFGAATSNASNFGAMNSGVSGFGATTSVNAVAPTFGTTNSFGSGTTFAQNSAFGGPASTPSNSSFGAVPSTQPGAFGATSTPSFGSAATTQAGSFATATAPTFGGFGTTSKDSAFGSTPAASFGTPAQPAVFGAATSNAPSFGATGSAFGKPQSATTNMFGGTPSSNPAPNAFGSGNAFATNPQQGTGGFGTTNTTTNPGAAFNFGAAPNQTVAKPGGVFSFGGTSAASGDKSKFNFSTASTAPSFGSTSTAPPSFGSTTTPFGGAAAPSFGGTAAPSFGGTAAPSFGGNATPSFGGTATPSFGGTATPSFGGTALPAFGSTNAPSFGAAAQPSFGAAQPAVPGTFSIGSGAAASGRPRTQIKAKRRT